VFVNLTRSALITASPDKRLDLLLDLSQQEGIQVYADAPNEPTEALSDRPFVKLFAEHLRKRLGEDTQLLAARPPSRAMWISFKIDDLDYWVRMPRDRIERSEQLSWVGWAALIFALSVAGAFLIVARINRPLRDLTRGAAELGSGQMPRAHQRVRPDGDPHARKCVQSDDRQLEARRGRSRTDACRRFA
jgi:two-component system osmolarity sensor histidine kinase EnvZ